MLENDEACVVLKADPATILELGITVNACVRAAEVIAAIKRLLILVFMELGENASRVVLKLIWAVSSGQLAVSRS